MARLQLEDYLPSLEETSAVAGGLSSLPVAKIDEDPGQPRCEFDDAALLELAATIGERGVLQPISVRPNMQAPGRWLLNFGARRLRASRLAGLTEIPCLIDATGDAYDQVIENEQREGLKPLELALFVQKRLAAGDSQADIARRLGKSRQYLTLATALIDAPGWLLDAYRQGRCRGMAELYELRRLHGDHPQVVEAWVAETPSVTRERVALLKDELMGQDEPMDEGRPPVAGSHPERQTEGDSKERAVRDVTSRSDRRQRPSRQIQVEFEGQDYQLVVDAAPQGEGSLYIRPLSGGARAEVPASALKLRGFVDR